MSEKYSKLYIDGVWRDGSSETIYDNVNPYNGEVVVRIKLANRDDIDEAYAAAKRAQKEWAKTPVEEKSRYSTALPSCFRKEKMNSSQRW
jgi:acyl-CoA reductase-like NAD-dependent aldehyde dehydrogenase